MNDADEIMNSIYTDAFHIQAVQGTHAFHIKRSIMRKVEDYFSLPDVHERQNKDMLDSNGVPISPHRIVPWPTKKS